MLSKPMRDKRDKQELTVYKIVVCALLVVVIILALVGASIGSKRANDFYCNYNTNCERWEK